MKKTLMTPWSSISDFMSALMMVFLFISVSYAYQVNLQSSELESKSNKIEQITTNYSNKKEEIFNDLNNQFSNRLIEWKAKIDKDSLTLQFQDPALLFEPGSSTLTPHFSYILSQFWVEYVDILKKHTSSIREIKIEGHTSSEWAGVSLDESYFNNMQLSQQRTRSTLQECYDLTPTSNRSWVRKYVTANGMSFSRPIRLTTGKEDSVKSRRVEFTVVVDSISKLDEIIGELK